MTLRLPLANNRIANFVSVYSPTLDSSGYVKDRFYDTLYSTLRRISQDDKIILLGDFNARVGRNNDNIMDNKISLGFHINNDASKHSSSNVSDGHPHAPLLTQQRSKTIYDTARI